MAKKKLAKKKLVMAWKPIEVPPSPVSIEDLARMRFANHAEYADQPKELQKHQPLLEKQLGALNRHGDHLDAIANQLECLAERILGAEPKVGAMVAREPNPGSSSMIGKLDDVHAWIDALRGRISVALTRLEKL